MTRYLFQVAYTPEAWAAQIKSPQNRLEQIRPAVESLGGKLESMYYAFGEYDVVALADFPDDVSAAAFSLSASAGGAIKSIRTTPLMMVEDGMNAMKKAAGSGYRPPQ
jgi:uncharacterized protein with GYD domain